MIELLVTCWVAAAATFAVPDGWAVREVRSPGDPCAWTRGPGWAYSVYCVAPPLGDKVWTDAKVVLARAAKVGEAVDLPAKCTADTITTGGGVKP